MNVKKFHNALLPRSWKPDELNSKYKTEPCRNWSLGLCTFGSNCFFAHGSHELRNKAILSSYKTKDCKQFHEIGYCQYGSRCQFRHRNSSPDTACESPEPLKDVKKTKSTKRLPIFQRFAPN